jgi:hypothetical protein
MAKDKPSGRMVPIEDRRRDDIEEKLRMTRPRDQIGAKPRNPRPGDRRTGVRQDPGKITGRDSGRKKP